MQEGCRRDAGGIQEGCGMDAGCRRDAGGMQEGCRNDVEGMQERCRMQEGCWMWGVGGMQEGCRRDAGGIQEGCRRDAGVMLEGCRRDAGCAAPALPGRAVLPPELPGAVGRIGTAGRLCSRPFPALPGLSRPFLALPSLSPPAFPGGSRPGSGRAPRPLRPASRAWDFSPFFARPFPQRTGGLKNRK